VPTDLVGLKALLAALKNQLAAQSAFADGYG
jgi:hypothetical protein